MFWIAFLLTPYFFASSMQVEKAFSFLIKSAWDLVKGRNLQGIPLFAADIRCLYSAVRGYVVERPALIAAKTFSFWVMYSRFSIRLSVRMWLMWFTTRPFGRGPKKVSATRECTVTGNLLPSTEMLITKYPVLLLREPRIFSLVPPLNCRTLFTLPKLEAKYWLPRDGTTFHISLATLLD